MKPNPTVAEIVREWLEQRSYDGLFNDDCGCQLSDLMPCGYPQPDCEAGYRREGCTPECGAGCDFHICREKPDADA